MIICSNCNYPNESFFQFCLQCGTDLSCGSLAGAVAPSVIPDDSIPAVIPAETENLSASPASDAAYRETTIPNDGMEITPVCETHREDDNGAEDRVLELGATEQSTSTSEESETPDAGIVDGELYAGRAGDTSPHHDITLGENTDDTQSTSVQAETDAAIANTKTKTTVTITNDEDIPVAEHPAVLEGTSTESAEDLQSTDAARRERQETPAQVRFMFDPTNISIPSAPFEPANLDDTSSDRRDCPRCGAKTSKSHSFCGQCGYRFEGAAPKRTPTGIISQVTAESSLVVIREDGSDGARLQLVEGSNVIGRGESTHTFASDMFLDSQHCEMRVDGKHCTLEDLGTLNGTFIRILEPTQLNHGDLIRLGQELLRYEHFERVEPVEAPAADGTELLGAAPGTDVFGRLVQVMSPDLVGNAWALSAPLVTIGRERGDVIFDGDGYVSGRHATITWRDGQAVLEDIGSSNGTYLQIRGPAELLDGDLVLIGQQLFRYENHS